MANNPLQQDMLELFQQTRREMESFIAGLPLADQCSAVPTAALSAGLPVGTTSREEWRDKMPNQQLQPDRPYMPDYGIRTGKDGMMSWEWVNEQMTESRNYWICSTKPDGRPHSMPVWGVWIDGVLYFSSSRQSRKARNLAANPEVVVHLESGDDAVILEGQAQEVTDKATLARMVKEYAAKYPPFKPDPENEPGNVYYAVKPQRAFAWQEKDFTGSATRWKLSR